MGNFSGGQKVLWMHMQGNLQEDYKLFSMKTPAKGEPLETGDKFFLGFCNGISLSGRNIEQLVLGSIQSETVNE